MAIEIKNICKQYDGKVVFKNLNLYIEDNEIICIMGASGIGKTTLFRILMGLTNIDCGEVLGLDKKRISAVFQEDRLCDYLDAITNIRLVCDNKKSDEFIKAELSKILPKECLTKPIYELSGGMKRRVAIVRAMIAKSDIILMDEPFKGLDEDLKNKVVKYILKERNNRSLYIITHQKDDCNFLKANKEIYL